MTDKELLDLYRKKRAVDGLNGRTWDSQKHLKYDQEIEIQESRPLFDGQEGDISNAAWRLAVWQGVVEAEKEKIRKIVIPATHAGRLAQGKN